MKATRLFPVLGAALFPLAVAMITSGGCKKDDTEPPPAASAPPAPTPTPPPVATVAPEEDAGSDAADAGDGSDGKVVVGTGDSTGIRRCCAALRQNAKSAPPEQVMGYQAAASACDGLVASPQGRQGLSSLRAFLRGAGMPAECK